MRGVIALAVSCVILGAVVSAGGQSSQRHTLKGLRWVSVVVEPFDAGLGDFGAQELKSAVELRLRKNGIPVHDEQDAGVLNVQVTLINLGDNSKPTFIHLIEVEFNQKVALVRQPLVLTTAATWRAAAHGSSNRAQLRGILREGSLMDMVDEFANDYLAANPKPMR